MKFEVRFTQTLQRTVTALVEAESRMEAIEKAMDWEVEEDDESDAPLDIVDEENYTAHEVLEGDSE
jgi:hypothetical protein